MTEPRPGVDPATSTADETVRVYVKAWHEPAAEYVNVPPGDLIPVVFDEPSDDVLLPRLAWMRREDVIFDAEVDRLRDDLAERDKRKPIAYRVRYHDEWLTIHPSDVEFVYLSDAADTTNGGGRAMSELDLDAIRARCDKATAGPWHIGDAVDPMTPCNVHAYPSAQGIADQVGWLDAEFIAAARSDVPALLAEVDRLRADLAETNALLEQSGEDVDLHMAQRDRALAALADAQEDKDRVWQVVQALRNRAAATTGDPYSDPVGQALSAALVNHKDFERLLAALSAGGADREGNDDD